MFGSPTDVQADSVYGRSRSPNLGPPLHATAARSPRAVPGQAGIQRLPRAVVEHLRLVHLTQLDELSDLRTRLRATRQDFEEGLNAQGIAHQESCSIPGFQHVLHVA